MPLSKGFALLLASTLSFATPAMAQETQDRTGEAATLSPIARTDRQILQLETLTLAGTTHHSYLKALEDDHSLADVAAHLDRMGIAYERGTGSLDTATLSPVVLQRIRALPDGEPFITPTPDGKKFVISVIIEPKPDSTY